MDPKPMISIEFRDMITTKLEDESRNTDMPVAQIVEELSAYITKREIFKTKLEAQIKEIMDNTGLSRHEVLVEMKVRLDEAHSSITPNRGNFKKTDISVLRDLLINNR
jgi:hypothetical protein